MLEARTIRTFTFFVGRVLLPGALMQSFGAGNE